MILIKTVETEKPQTKHRPRAYALELAIERGNQDKIVSPRTRRIQKKFCLFCRTLRRSLRRSKKHCG